MAFPIRFTAVAVATLMLAHTLPVGAQDIGARLIRSVERAAESEVQRAADRGTRRVVRCALGDERCARDARAAGHEIEIYDSPERRQAPAMSAAAEIGPSYQHPLISPYYGSVLRWRDSNQVAFDEYRRIIGYDSAAREPVTETVTGRVSRLVYDNPSGRSIFEILSNYRNALEARGARIDWSCDSRNSCGSTRGWRRINGFDNSVLADQRYFTGMLRQGNQEVYFAIGAYTHRHTIHLVEVEAMDEDMVAISADVLGSALEREGRVELQGIYFETGRAQLTPASQPALDQVAMLMRNQPQLRLNVVGHTDNVGAADLNLRLSQDRADAVRQALEQAGVEGSRLSAQGVGSALPKASNDTEQGRASNRRVELVRQ